MRSRIFSAPLARLPVSRVTCVARSLGQMRSAASRNLSHFHEGYKGAIPPWEIKDQSPGKNTFSSEGLNRFEQALIDRVAQELSLASEDVDAKVQASSSLLKRCSG